ncbi:hypothetical protein ASNO1_17040 [Corallococcus caeni]|uniref:Uncharacterized protein n=1 Tax=Corallococcus caeni TaxID=3082388 RepID=A0ABQ6QNK5_9BACT|nr:hypothetical protein ASNO1_17040 [Corallococcus sp. NO1]
MAQEAAHQRLLPRVGDLVGGELALAALRLRAGQPLRAAVQAAQALGHSEVMDLRGRPPPRKLRCGSLREGRSASGGGVRSPRLSGPRQWE